MFQTSLSVLRIILLSTLIIDVRCSQFTADGYRYVSKDNIQDGGSIGGSARVVIADRYEMGYEDDTNIGPCAVKLVQPTTSARMQMDNEGRAFRRLNSPQMLAMKPTDAYFTKIYNDGNIIKFTDSGTQYQALVMQPHQISLYDLKRNRDSALSPEEICIIGTQVLYQLEYLFIAQIAHRDLKPGNLMVEFGHTNISEQTKIYIIDFGLALFDGCVKGIEGQCFVFGTANYVVGEASSTSSNVESLVYDLVYLGTGTLSWFVKAWFFNSNPNRSMDSQEYLDIVNAKKDLASNIKDNIPAELKTILLEMHVLALGDKFNAALCRTFAMKFQTCLEKLKALVHNI